MVYEALPRESNGCYDLENENVLVDVCLREMIENYCVHFENPCFSYLSQPSIAFQE